MCDDRKVGKAGITAVASLLTLALVALPVAPGLDGLSLDGTAAYAKGPGSGGGNGGGGNGGGNGGGSGNGGGHGPGGGPGANASAAGHGGTAPGHSGSAPGQSGSAPGHSGVSGLGHSEDAHEQGLTASALGNLNAAHASATAMSKASIDSIVGKIGALVEAQETDENAISVESLSEISNKTVDAAVVDAVKGLVEGKVVDRSDD